MHVDDSMLKCLIGAICDYVNCAYGIGYIRNYYNTYVRTYMHAPVLF